MPINLDRSINVILTEFDARIAVLELAAAPAPTITSASSGSIAENSPFTVSLTANEAVTWGKVGGADTTLFNLTGSTLSLSSRNFDSPTDADANNVYQATVRATSTTTGKTADQNIAVTISNLNDTTANAFSFSALTGATASTPQISGIITVAGLGASDSATATVSGAVSSLLSKNGGAFVSGPVTVSNGDTIGLGHTASGAAGGTTTTTLTIGTTTANFVSTVTAAAPSILSASTRAEVHVAGGTESATTWRTARFGHRTNSAGTNLRFYDYAGFVSSAGACPDIPGTAPVRVRRAVITGIGSSTAVDASAGTLTICTFNDMLNDTAFMAACSAASISTPVSDSGRLLIAPAGTMYYTDKVPVTLAIGDRYYEQVEKGCVNGTSMGTTQRVASQGDFSSSASSSTDTNGVGCYSKNPSLSGIINAIFGGAMAITIEGAPSLVSYQVHGDSIWWGSAGSGATQDPQNTDGVRGGIPRAMADLGYSSFKMACPGRGALTYFSNQSTNVLVPRLSAAVGSSCGGTITNLGTNDRAAAWATAGPALQWWWGKLHEWTNNAPIVQATLAPRTSSSNGYVDEAGQRDDILGAAHWNWTLLNPNLRAGNYSALGTGTQKPDRWYEYCASMESLTVPRVFKGGETTDGSHPTVPPLGHGTVYNDAVVRLPRVMGLAPTVLPSISLTQNRISHIEPTSGTKNFVFPISAIPAPSTDLTVNLQFTAGDTIAADYVGGVLPNISSVVIPAGQTSVNVTIAVAANGTTEADERFSLSVLAGTGYERIAPSICFGVIQTNDFTGGVVYQTDFTAADNTLAVDPPFNLTMSGPGAGPTAADIANYKINNNQLLGLLRWSTAGNNFGHLVRDTLSANHSVTFNRVNAVWEMFPVIGEIDGDNFLYINSLITNGVPGFQLSKMQAGVSTTAIVNTYWWVPAAAIKLEVRLSGGTIAVFADDVQYINQAFSSTPVPATGTTTVAVPGTAPTGGTKAGVYTQAAGSGRIDNLLIKQI